MRVNRRLVLGAAVAAALPPRLLSYVSAEGTAVATTDAAPGYAIARVRALPTRELNAAVVPDVLASFLPRMAALPGYAGYVLGEHLTDPAATISLTMLADESAVSAADQVARDYVTSLGSRFVVKTPVAAQGPLRIYQVTTRSAADLPPFLQGCQLTMRNRLNAPGADMESVISKASEGLVPMLAAMPGFVLYCWIQTEDGRTAINIWETLDQVEAGNEAVATWVAANTANTTTGEPIVNDGVVAYADIPDFI